MKFNDGKTISAYVRSKLHSGYITLQLSRVTLQVSVNTESGENEFFFFKSYNFEYLHSHTGFLF